MRIYTIGHSNITEENFIQVLQFYDANLVIDIRRFPSSKKFPQFSRRHIEDKGRLGGGNNTYEKENKIL